MSSAADRAAIREWVAAQMKAAITDVIAMGVVEAEFFESKPAWVMPTTLVIARVRLPGIAVDHKWMICGLVQTDLIDAAVAATPRDAARHFALKWQLEASRSGGTDASRLIEQAESLYQLVLDDRLWPAWRRD